MATLNLQVEANADDVQHAIKVAHIWNNAATTYRLGQFNEYFYDYCARFTGVTIGQGETINSAYFRLCCAVADAATSPEAKVRAEDADDAVACPNDAGHDARHMGGALTTAGIDWDPGAWVVDTWYSSPDIKTVIQEPVDRVGWAGAGLIIVTPDDGSANFNYRSAYSHDNDDTKAPKLDIDYTPAAIGVDEMMAAIGQQTGGGGGSGDIMAHSRKPPEVIAY